MICKLTLRSMYCFYPYACREGNDTSPLTNERLQHKMLMPCGAMQRCVDEVLQYVQVVRQQVL